MITGILQNKYICINNKSTAQTKDLTRISLVLIKIVSKYSITKLRQVTGRVVDLWSALGPAATFVYNKCKKEIKLYHK